MKRLNLKIICILLVSVLLVSDIYSNFYSVSVVYADEETEMYEDIVLAVLGVVGVAIAGTTPAAIVAGGYAVVQCFDAGTSIGNYIFDNGDGTVTISAEGVQATLDALEQYEKCNGFDKNSIYNMQNGNYEYNYFLSFSCLNVYGYKHEVKWTGVRSSQKRCAGYIYTDSSTDITYLQFYCDNSILNGFNGTQNIITHGDAYGPNVNEYNSTSWSYGMFGSNRSYTYGANFPVFSDEDSCSNYLSTGEGYENAQNYNKITDIRKGSSYSPTYNGTGITFKKDKVENLPNKISEICEDEDDTDIIINLIIEYLEDDEESTTEEETTAEEETSTEDSTADTDGDGIVDLTDTNNWLKKIYNRLGDIMKLMKKLHDTPFIDIDVEDNDVLIDIHDIFLDLILDVDVGVPALVDDLNVSFTPVVNQMKTKFPFSIPWDIAFLIAFLAESPTTPVFKIPFKLDAYGIDYVVEINMDKFQAVSDVSRMLLTLLYMICLMQLTSKIINNSKE